MNDSATPCVLAVDDDILMRAMLEDNLVDAGYDVMLAEDGEMAWDLLQQHPRRIECMVLDRMMPRLDGMGLLRRAKADPRFRHLPVIFETAAGEPAEMAEGIAAGAYYYLVKPFDSQILITLVRSAIEDYRNILGQVAAEAERHVGLSTLRYAEFQLRSLNEVHALTPLLAQMFPDPQRVNLGILELLINAVEHGNLGIDYATKTRLVMEDSWHAEVERRLALPEYREKAVTIIAEHGPDEIRLLIRDEGQGFDWSDYLAISPERALDPHGRGIAMSKLISFDRLEYRGRGNEVAVSVKL